MRCLQLLTLTLCALPIFTWGQSFNQAKQTLRTLYQQHGTSQSFYCQCDIRFNGKQMSPNFARCGYQPRKQMARAGRIEWEHVVSAWEFGHQLQCWQQGGRKRCQRTSSLFKQMEGDMHNLFPAIGEINNDRANFRFSDWGGQAHQYGQCAMVVDFKGRKVQPPQNAVRGRIARSYLYMSQRYGLRLASQQRQLFNAWNNQYPADQWECLRNLRIAKQQGNSNSFIEKQCAQPNLLTQQSAALPMLTSYHGY